MINCSESLEIFKFLIPDSKTFYVTLHRTNYDQNYPITKLMGFVSRYSVDLFFYNNIVSFNVYLNNVINIL